MTTLFDIWMERKEFFKDKSIDQIIAIAGDGNLRDGSKTSVELRELLSNIPSTSIERYIENCLSNSFDQNLKGFVLQDLVNEVGKRLGFLIEPGPYRGGGSRIGFDGIWRAKNEFDFVIEVKTTDTYQINLNTQAQYRKRLIDEKRICEKNSSILVVVGRNDTGGLEAQTRGSRHAWDIRLISVDALLKLMQVKENLTDAVTVSQIQEILKPYEYTRVDRLIDIIFTTSEDLQIVDIDSDVEPEEIGETTRTPSRPVKFHEACVDRISTHLAEPLVKQGRCTYTNADQKTRVLCIISREYQRSGAIRYWYAFHPSQQKFLNEGVNSFVALGCGSAQHIVLFPSEEFQKHLPKMRTTESRGRYYWHVEIFRQDGRYLLNKPTPEGSDITAFIMK
jgi:hypothetical protein